LVNAVVTIYGAEDTFRGKTGSFVAELHGRPARPFGAMYVNFSVSGTAIRGVDYVQLVSPVYIDFSVDYGVISVTTLRDPRASFIPQAYSVVVTLEPGPAFEVGESSSATMLIEP